MNCGIKNWVRTKKCSVFDFADELYMLPNLGTLNSSNSYKAL